MFIVCACRKRDSISCNLELLYIKEEKIVTTIKIMKVMKDIDRRKTLDIFSLLRKLDIKFDY